MMLDGIVKRYLNLKRIKETDTNMHYYQFNLSDYITSTAHLTPTEDIIYRRLIDLYYEKETPIPDETQLVSRKIRMVKDGDLVGLILREFFTLLDDNCWHHDRCDTEIAKYKSRAVTAKANGSKGGRPKKPKKTQSVKVANPTESKGETNQEPRTTNHKPKKEPQEKKITFLDTDFKLAQQMYRAILAINNKQKEPNFNSWANSIRLIRDRDNKSIEEIVDLFQWANNDDFWRMNILSPDKLRKQWDKLTIQKNNKPTHKGSRNLSLGERATKAREEVEKRYITEHQTDIKLV